MLKELVSREPVATGGLGGVIVNVALAFGVTMSAEQAAAVAAVASIVVALVVRKFVTPTKTLKD